jgi:hypothetical protein
VCLRNRFSRASFWAQRNEEDENTVAIVPGIKTSALSNAFHKVKSQEIRCNSDHHFLASIRISPRFGWLLLWSKPYLFMTWGQTEPRLTERNDELPTMIVDKVKFAQELI